MERSPLAAPSSTHPVYVRKTDTTIKVFPSSPTSTYTVNNVTCNYVAKPTEIVWGYTDVSGTALYNSGTTTDPELHESEETTLVIKILALAGITLQDPSMYQIATAEDNKKHNKKNHKIWVYFKVHKNNITALIVLQQRQAKLILH